MKITAIPKIPARKSDNLTVDTNANQKMLNKERTESRANANERKAMRNIMSKKQRQDSTSNSSCCSGCTESDDDSDSSSLCSKNKITPKSIKHNANNKLHKNGSNIRRNAVTTKRTINQKKANMETSDSNTESSDESSDSEPTEKRSPLPKSKPTFKNDFFKPTTAVANQNQNLNADGASSSDMELPALVSAAIQRVESGSDEENTKIEQNSKTQYDSSLLREFVTKTQMMGSSITTSNHMPMPNTDSKHSNDGKTTTKFEPPGNSDTVVKRKRGRPRKNPVPAINLRTNLNSGSPDSGITSTPQSPVPSSKNSTLKSNKKSSTVVAKKIDISTLEKNMYATERVLYPPRRKRQLPQLQSDTSSKSRDNQSIEKVDPIWRKIDINKKFRRPSECGYRSDTNTICSKVLAAQSGYTSDYCNVNRRILSGYKSDYSCKSRRSGYKSDYSVNAKSCGYRSDCGTRHRRKIRRKRRTKTVSSKPSVNDQDILMLAGLSLGHSDDSSLDSTDKPPVAPKPSSSHKTTTKSNSISHSGKKIAATKVSTSKSLPDDVLSNHSERVPKHKSSGNFESLLLSMNDSITSSIYKDGDSSSLKLDRMKPGMIRRRRSSAVSHCSSHCSTSSRHPFRRRRRRRLKSTNDQGSETNLAKINQQIESLTSSFTQLCAINVEKPIREKEIASKTVKSNGSRRTGKKRKTNQENAEVPAVNSTTTSKRRNKKTVQTKSPDDHKLPLKKRHYLLTPGEKNESVIADEKDSEQAEPENDADISGKAVTPKKRHLLQTPVDLNDVVDSTDATSNSTCKDLQEIQASVSVSITDISAPTKGTLQSKKNENTRKKSRIEHLASKAIPNTQINVESTAKSTMVPKSIAPALKNTATAVKSTSTTLKTSTPRSKPTLTTTAITKSLSAKSLQPVVTVALKSQPAAPKSKQTSTANTQPTPDHNSITKASSSSRLNHIRSSKSESTPPPGVFEPSIDLELQIPFTEIPIPPITQKTNAAANRTDSSKYKSTKSVASKATDEGVIEKLLHRTGAASKIGKKKRKKPNRTGFPTLKKKKKPIVKAIEVNEPITLNSKIFASEPKIILDCVDELMLQKLKAACDRVPSDGETTGTFIERNSKALDSSADKMHDKTKVKSAGKKLKTLPKTANKQNENKQMEVSDHGNDSKHGDKKLKQKQIDPKDKVLQKEKPVEVQSTARRGRPPINRAEINSVVPAKSMKLSKPQATNSKPSPSKSESTVAKASDRTPKVKTDKRDGDLLTKNHEKVQAVGETKKTSTEQSKLDKGQKRGINGRIIASANRKSYPIDSARSEMSDENKSRKKARRDLVDEIKSESNKRTASPSIHNDTSAVDKKRARTEKIEPMRSPSTREKAHSRQKAVSKETVTDINDIVPVDAWIKPMDQDPLPPQENVHYIDSISDSAQTSDNKKSNTKPKKKYLAAGLFSNYYKTDLLLPTEKSSKSTSTNDKKTPDDEQTPESLLPMPFFDKYLLQTQIDFRLPYDLWYAHENDKLSGRNIVHSWNFKKIRTNIYADSVKPIQSPDLPQCSCKSEYECGENCLNRLVYTECVPETCPCGDKCRNTKIQKHIVAPVERFMTASKGWGVKTNQLIKKGTYILEYVGEVVTEREFKDRMATLYTNDIHHYCLHLDGGLVIDGHRMGSDCRFVNHSCEPNCEMQKWSVNGLSRMALFAHRDIRPTEELTYDYNFSLFNPAEGQVCKCESVNCRGVIGGKSQRIRPIENKVCFEIFFFLRRKIC